jgi:hypothetical protein
VNFGVYLAPKKDVECEFCDLVHRRPDGAQKLSVVLEKGTNICHYRDAKPGSPMSVNV